MTNQKTKVKPQGHMDETVIEDVLLEQQLDERQELKVTVSQYNKLNKEIKEKLKGIEVPSPFRIGRYVINRTMGEDRHVEFDSTGGLRFSIKLAGEE